MNEEQWTTKLRAAFPASPADDALRARVAALERAALRRAYPGHRVRPAIVGAAALLAAGALLYPGLWRVQRDSAIFCTHSLTVGLPSLPSDPPVIASESWSDGTRMRTHDGGTIFITLQGPQRDYHYDPRRRQVRILPGSRPANPEAAFQSPGWKAIGDTGFAPHAERARLFENIVSLGTGNLQNKVVRRERMVLVRDAQTNRPLQFRQYQQAPSGWRLAGITFFDYNLPIPSSFLEPSFPPDVTITEDISLQERAPGWFQITDWWTLWQQWRRRG